MRQPAFIVATLTGSLLFASAAGVLRVPDAWFAGTSAAPHVLPAQPQAAASAALAAAIVHQFPGHAVDVVLGTPRLADAGPMQQEVQATASVRIDDSAPMPVHAAALYDRDARSIVAPTLRFERTTARAASSAMRAGLAVAVAGRLDAEFAGQPLTLSLADADAATVGGRYLHLVARGTTDFGAEGRAATTIDALYDPRTGEWLRLDYVLGADPADGNASFAEAGLPADDRS